jgi:hypothetical protein
MIVITITIYFFFFTPLDLAFVFFDEASSFLLQGLCFFAIDGSIGSMNSLGVYLGACSTARNESKTKSQALSECVRACVLQIY